jgi:hypothetical protein
VNLPEVQRSSVRHHVHFRRKENRDTLGVYRKQSEFRIEKHNMFQDFKILSILDLKEKQPVAGQKETVEQRQNSKIIV